MCLTLVDIFFLTRSKFSRSLNYTSRRVLPQEIVPDLESEELEAGREEERDVTLRDHHSFSQLTQSSSCSSLLLPCQ